MASIAEYYTPDFAIGGGPKIGMVFQSTPSGSTGFEIMLTTSTEAGATWSEPIQLTYAPLDVNGLVGSVKVVSDGGGSYLAPWLDNREFGGSDSFISFSRVYTACPVVPGPFLGSDRAPGVKIDIRDGGSERNKMK